LNLCRENQIAQMSNFRVHELLDNRSGADKWRLSIVVPAMNEGLNIQRLVAEVEESVVALVSQTELIIVDDGSTDQTAHETIKAAATRPWVRLVRHSRRCGQSAAMNTGIQAARGQFLATLDADLQNDPADLPRLLTIVANGEADMAQGLRARRQDNIVRKITSWIGRTARRLLLRDNIRDTGCSTRVMRTEVARLLPLQYAGMHRFVPVYARMLGATVMEVAVSHRPRVAGQTKYGVLNRGWSGLLDCFAVRWMRSRLRTIELMPEVVEATHE